MTTFIDLTCCVSYLRTTSNLALTCKGFYQWLKLNSFPIRTSKGELCLENLAFYKVLDCPFLDDWMSEQVFRSLKVHPDRLQLLLQENVNLETKNDNGETVLILAARRGRADHLKILLEHKADTKATDKNSNTALIRAAMNGQTACLKLLLEHKAPIDNYAITFAIYKGDYDIAFLLFKNNAHIDKEDLVTLHCYIELKEKN